MSEREKLVCGKRLQVDEKRDASVTHPLQRRLLRYSPVDNDMIYADTPQEVSRSMWFVRFSIGSAAA